MTYQKQSQTHDDEASLLLTVVTASPAPSLSLVQGGGMPARKKKNGVPMMRAVIATCSLLGILAVIYYGGRDVSSNTAGLGGISAALLLGQNQAASVYDPSQDFCFTDHDHPGKLCWYPIHRYPCGNWRGGDSSVDGQCGDKCTKVYCYNHSRYRKCVSEPDKSQCAGHP